MKKLYYRLLLVIIVLACAMPFVMKDRYGRPLMTLADLKMPGLHVLGKDMFEGLINKNRDNIPLSDNEAVMTVYRWQDDQDVWHFSDDVNPDGQSEAIDVQLNASVTGMVVLEPEKQTQQTKPDVEKLLESGAMPLINAAEILEQARNVEGLLQQRHQRQEESLSQ